MGKPPCGAEHGLALSLAYRSGEGGGLSLAQIVSTCLRGGYRRVDGGGTVRQVTDSHCLLLLRVWAPCFSGNSLKGAHREIDHSNS